MACIDCAAWHEQLSAEQAAARRLLDAWDRQGPSRAGTGGPYELAEKVYSRALRSYRRSVTRRRIDPPAQRCPGCGDGLSGLLATAAFFHQDMSRKVGGDLATPDEPDDVVAALSEIVGEVRAVAEQAGSPAVDLYHEATAIIDGIRPPRGQRKGRELLLPPDAQRLAQEALESTEPELRYTAQRAVNAIWNAMRELRHGIPVGTSPGSKDD
jgi:hypothetical protein